MQSASATVCDNRSTIHLTSYERPQSDAQTSVRHLIDGESGIERARCGGGGAGGGVVVADVVPRAAELQHLQQQQTRRAGVPLRRRFTITSRC